MVALDGDCPQAASFKDNATREVELTSQKRERLHQVQLGKPNVVEHIINTGDAPPVKVPPQPIPFQYQDRMQDQLQEMVLHTQPLVCPSCVHDKEQWGDQDLCGLCAAQQVHKEGLLPSAQSRRTPTEVCTEAGVLQD